MTLGFELDSSGCYYRISTWRDTFLSSAFNSRVPWTRRKAIGLRAMSRDALSLACRRSESVSPYPFLLCPHSPGQHAFMSLGTALPRLEVGRQASYGAGAPTTDSARRRSNRIFEHRTLPDAPPVLAVSFLERIKQSPMWISYSTSIGSLKGQVLNLL